MLRRSMSRLNNKKIETALFITLGMITGYGIYALTGSTWLSSWVPLMALLFLA